MRNGVIRAQGPFSHALLAGSIGSVCLPLIVPLWSQRRGLAVLGICGCLAIIVASGSSGPILAGGAGIGALLLYSLRARLQLVRWAAVLLYVGLEVVMNRPAYFIISDVDLMGGSTSWYRAQLIRSTFAHLHEWWLVGTDYTRHWMPTGVPYSLDQTDITNHYIAMGVVGGLPLMLLFIAILVKGFWNVGNAMRSVPDERHSLSCWAVGAALFAQAVTCLSLSYYDHSIMFLYLTLAATTATLTKGSYAAAAQPPVGIVGLRPRSTWRDSRLVPSAVNGQPAGRTVWSPRMNTGRDSGHRQRKQRT